MLSKRNPWSIGMLTLFPEMFPGPLGFSLAGRALDEKLWNLNIYDIRRFCEKSAEVDSSPFGGGNGMVMRADVIDRVLSTVTQDPNYAQLPVVYMTPRGTPLTQEKVKIFSQGDGAIILCGRYEGVDERAVAEWGMEEISVGDYVLSGGEPAAISFVDACVRLLPGVVGKEESLEDESFEEGLLEYPHYTRPRIWKHREVPEVLVSGHHNNVKSWRLAEAERITRARRPDLWDIYMSKQN